MPGFTRVFREVDALGCSGGARRGPSAPLLALSFPCVQALTALGLLLLNLSVAERWSLVQRICCSVLRTRGLCTAWREERLGPTVRRFISEWHGLSQYLMTELSPGSGNGAVPMLW